MLTREEMVELLRRELPREQVAKTKVPRKVVRRASVVKVAAVKVKAMPPTKGHGTYVCADCGHAKRGWDGDRCWLCKYKFEHPGDSIPIRGGKPGKGCGRIPLDETSGYQSNAIRELEDCR